MITTILSLKQQAQLATEASLKGWLETILLQRKRCPLIFSDIGTIGLEVMSK